jgi:hypothetical protein
MSLLGMYMSIAPEPRSRDSRNAKPLISIYKVRNQPFYFSCAIENASNLCRLLCNSPSPNVKSINFCRPVEKWGKQIVEAAKPGGRDSAETSQPSTSDGIETP